MKKYQNIVVTRRTLPIYDLVKLLLKLKVYKPGYTIQELEYYYKELTTDTKFGAIHI